MTMMLVSLPIHTHSIEDDKVSHLVSAILNQKFDSANRALEESFNQIVTKKLHEMKKMVAAKMFAEMDLSREKPDHDSIEDRREGQIVQDANKTSLPKAPKPQSNVTVVTKNNIKEEDEEQLDEARIKIVTRVRGGKIQRRKKLSNVQGMTLRGGKLTRMSPAERRKRKMGARKAKIKRKSKMSRAIMKRKRSLMRRKAMGL